MKRVKLKVEQNGGEYYGFVVISNINSQALIKKKDSNTVLIDNLKIQFDEFVEILEDEVTYE